MTIRFKISVFITIFVFIMIYSGAVGNISFAMSIFEKIANNNITSISIFDQIKSQNKQTVSQIQHHYAADLQLNFPTRKFCVATDDVQINIYMYHYIRPELWDTVGGVVYGNSITPENFDKQMSFLHEREVSGKTQIALFSEITKRKDNDCFPNSTITVLMADDGRRDNYENLFPIIKKYHIKTNIGIIVNRISFTEKRIQPFMIFDEIQEMSNHPLIEVASHSMTHSDLETLTYKEQKYEICQSKKELEKYFKKTITTFVVPFGRYTEYSAGIAEECGYDFTVLTIPGKTNGYKIKNMPHQLDRIRVYKGLTPEELFGDDIKIQ